MFTSAELLVFLVTLILILIFRKLSEKRKLLDGFPGPKGIPLLGNLLDLSDGKGPFNTSI
jgi:hypothetical protein